MMNDDDDDDDDDTLDKEHDLQNSGRVDMLMTIAILRTAMAA